MPIRLIHPFIIFPPSNIHLSFSLAKLPLAFSQLSARRDRTACPRVHRQVELQASGEEELLMSAAECEKGGAWWRGGPVESGNPGPHSEGLPPANASFLKEVKQGVV